MCKPFGLSYLGVLGMCLTGRGLKYRGARYRVQNLHSERSCELGPPSQMYVALSKLSVWQERVMAFPTCYDTGFVLFCFHFFSMCMSCSASFWVSFRGNCSISSYRLGLSVGSLHLGPALLTLVVLSVSI